MATYKKRGYKPKTKEAVEAVEGNIEEQSTTAEVFNSLDEGASKTEEWVAANQNYILMIVGAVVLVTLAFWGYQNFIQEPNEEEASNEIFTAQQYFNDALNGNAATRDSLYTLALNGTEGKYGFLQLIENYGSTAAGNLSHYYAGFSYLNLGEYKKTIRFLQDFDSDDEMLAPLAKGGIGDAFSQLNQLEDALKYYKEAAALQVNDFTTPRFLLKTAITALELKKTDIAIKALERIKNEFPKSTEANQVEVHLGKAKAMVQ